MTLDELNPSSEGNGNSEIDNDLYEERKLVAIEIDNTVYHIDPVVDDLINNLVLQIRELQELSSASGFKSN